MSLSIRWVGEADHDRVAETRLRCYASASKDLEKYKIWLRDARAKPGDFALAEDARGECVGTATSLSLTMWVRGAALPCQGVAWVGTVRSARRSAGQGPSPRPAGAAGVATQIMREVLRKAREREQVVSALMPFRASFYEHFGYGIVERRVLWQIPLSILPGGDCTGFRYARPDDVDAGRECRQRQVQSGQCDIETIGPMFDSEDGFELVDRPDGAGPIRGWMFLTNEDREGKRHLKLNDPCYDSRDALLRQLRMLRGMRDQFSGLVVSLPTDLPLNLLLGESQVPHRPVEHPTAVSSLYTRMQVRVLDHVRFLSSLKVPETARESRGSVVVSVRETEGHESRFRFEVDSGSAAAKTSSETPQVTCNDVTWAAIACGALSATQAAAWGLISMSPAGPRSLAPLDLLSTGPAPFCNEYF